MEAHTHYTHTCIDTYLASVFRNRLVLSEMQSLQEAVYREVTSTYREDQPQSTLWNIGALLGRGRHRNSSSLAYKGVLLAVNQTKPFSHSSCP